MNSILIIWRACKGASKSADPAFLTLHFLDNAFFLVKSYYFGNVYFSGTLGDNPWKKRWVLSPAISRGEPWKKWTISHSSGEPLSYLRDPHVPNFGNTLGWQQSCLGEPLFNSPIFSYLPSSCVWPTQRSTSTYILFLHLSYFIFVSQLLFLSYFLHRL